MRVARHLLALTWQEHLDPELRFITVRQDKTSKTLRRPHVVPISEQLRVILRDARQRTHTHVVEYRQRPVTSINGGLRLAVERAGLRFGRAVGGATFHTLRHTAASLLAELGESEAIRKEVMGIATSPRRSAVTGISAYSCLLTERASSNLPFSASGSSSSPGRSPLWWCTRSFFSREARAHIPHGKVAHAGRRAAGRVGGRTDLLRHCGAEAHGRRRREPLAAASNGG
ncbi:MAG: tyrosine-type recombinase/integrase [Luteitalea sp.]|nr:tyrosine-type recombinase/integrase [Luteitalea sp.]